MEAGLRVLQITDTHLFGDPAGRLAGMETDSSSLEVIERVMADFWPADLILATGDIVHDGTEQAYRRFKERFEQFGVPTLVIPGNHDRPELLRRIMRGGFVQAVDHFLLDQWLFVMLDSTVPGTDGGHLTESELALLERRLSAYPDHHAMVCLHHHPVSVDCDWIDLIGVDNGDALFAVIDRFPQVRSVVWGHIHQDYSGERNGVQLYASPSTCVQFKPQQTNFALDDLPPGFRWFELYPDGRIVSAVERLDDRIRGVDLLSGGYS
ncbi:MAG TPA: 3',5'-cyclic-AMP phosphodiesterase [Gammaproteobacteria bacterium]|nr:3',5'-cyclic-AMP phosphodiesterase [Gammaproteobacteria bacterium]